MLTALVLLALAAADAPKAAPVADPTYIPQAGDRAVFDTQRKDEDGDPYLAWAVVSLDDFKTATRLTYEQNNDALDKLEDSHKILTFEPGTPVQILELAPIPMVRNGQAVGGVICASVQVLSGPSRGKTVYTTPGFLAQYVAGAVQPATTSEKRKTSKAVSRRKPPAEKKATAEAPAPDPAAQAASTLRIAQSLEKAGKTKGAVDFYRQLLKQYPASPQAKTAAERIKALEGK